jgi:hypothetical protein
MQKVSSLLNCTQKFIESGNFDLNLVRTDSFLTIEAENRVTQTPFLKKISGDISKLTNKMFQSLDDLYQALLTGMSRNSRDVKVTINDQAQIEYIRKENSSEGQKTSGFVIVLEPTEEREVDKLRRTVIKLTEKYENLGLKLQNVKLNDEFEKLNFDFETKSAHSEKFRFENHNKTIIRKGTVHNNWYEIYSDTPIPKTGKHYYRLLLEKCTLTKDIMVGYASGASRNDTNIEEHYAQPGQYLYYCGNGCIQEKGILRHSGPELIEGDVVDVKIDMDRKMVIWEFNGYQIGISAIRVDTLTYDFFAVVYFKVAGDRVTLV